MKVVINTCYGVFELSDMACLEYCKRKGIEKIRRYDIPRDDPDIINIVETMGEASWGKYAKLEIIDIPDGIDWKIGEHAGEEWVYENHRTWGN